MTHDQRQRALRRIEVALARLAKAEEMALRLTPRTPEGKRLWGDIVDLISWVQDDLGVIRRSLD